MNKKILVYGAGYVGLSNGLLLAKKNDVTIVDINQNIINLLNNKKVHIDDEGCAKEIVSSTAKFLLKGQESSNDFNYVILALPTNYDDVTNSFDTKFLDNQINELNRNNFTGAVIIKSTVPIGYTQKIKEQYPNLRIVFSPEFLREGSSFDDALHPSRVIIGNKRSQDIGELFTEVSEGDFETIYTTSTSAEAIKLFANTYLAMRVAFVNELAIFARLNGLDKDEIIKGVGLDKRIGLNYFTPSAGYGGYCLPKDSKQLRYEFNDKKIPSKLFDAIVESNELRKEFIVNEIIKSGEKEIVINGIGHKQGVKNFRNSPKLEIASMLKEKGINVSIVDKNFVGQIINGFEIKSSANGIDLDTFI